MDEGEAGTLSVELTIKAMQRQLLQISDRIPDDILLALLKCFAQILTREPEESSKACGPFIRAFAKIRDDGADKQFQAIIEEDEDQSKNVAPHNDDDNNNECTFNYKVSNVVTQEVVYSVGNGSGNDEDAAAYENGHSSKDDHHDMPQLLDPDEEIKLNEEEQKVDEAVIEEKFEEIAKEGEVEDENTEQLTPIVKETEITETANEIVEDLQNTETIEQDPRNTPIEEQEKPQIDENIEEPAVEEVKFEEPQPQEERPVMPMQTVSLDDIQREIQEMQMFLFNKGIVPEPKVKSHRIHKKLKQLEDSFKVDFCVNLKKRGPGERSSKSKAILANYLNDHPHGKHAKGEKEKRAPIFDPNVPNTPEDFLKEKSVSEKINKKKQKIKHLDVSWQKLCDSQKKVYKHSNFKQITAE